MQVRVLLVGMAVAGSLVGCGKASHKDPSGATADSNLATTVAGDLKDDVSFAQTAEANQVGCTADGTYLGGHRFQCDITFSTGETRTFDFLYKQGDEALISEGGNRGAAPASAAGASEVLQSVAAAASSSGEAPAPFCQPVATDSITGLATPHSYNCGVAGAVLYYRWNDDGTIANDHIVSATGGGGSGSGNTGNSGSGNTGNSGSGNTGNSGSGNSGSGNTGNSGSGNTGNSGSGNTGDSGSGNTGIQ